MKEHGFEPVRRPKIRLIPGRLKVRKEVTEPLKRGVFLVPAAITSLGLLSGFYSLISSINHHFELAATMIVVAFFCDGLDGRVARASRTSSQFGIEYDSLSDVVAFGVAPAGLIYMFALTTVGSIGWVLSGAYVVCAALRLARFNTQVGMVDKRRFVGLPVPGAAMMIAGVVLAYSYFEFDSARVLSAFAAPLTLALACLMISRVPYPSFKSIKHRDHAPVELFALVLIGVAVMITLPQLTAFALGAAYVLSGPFLYLRGQRIARAPAPPAEGVQRQNHDTPAAGDRSTRSLPA
jgi:CDP-diacylglycerol--serine O-phosphatidyltransferase